MTNDNINGLGQVPALPATGDYRQTKANNHPLEAASFIAAKDGTTFKFGTGLYTKAEALEAAEEYNEYIKMRDLMSILLATTEPSSAQMLANGESNKKIREWLESIVKEMVESARSTQTKQMLKQWASRYPDLAYLVSFREVQIDHLKSSGLELGDTDSYTDETIARAHDDFARIKKVKADISQARQDNVWYKIASGIDLNPINDIKEAARHLKAITSLARDKWDWSYDKFSVRV